MGLETPAALIQQRFQRFYRTYYGAESEVLSVLLGIRTVVSLGAAGGLGIKGEAKKQAHNR